MRYQLIGAALPAGAADTWMRGKWHHFFFDKINHFFCIGRTILGNMLTDFYQVVDGMFFPLDGVHARPLNELDRGAHLTHRLVMRNAWADVLDRLLHLGLKPF